MKSFNCLGFCCSIYELERLAQVPHKFQFPLFETFHWFAAKIFYEELKRKFINSFNHNKYLIINRM